MIIKLFKFVGGFAENKDIARDLRINKISPTLKTGTEVILDFDKIDSVTQSFIHALISDLIRTYGVEILDTIAFKNCNPTIRKVIDIVVDYMQESD